MLTVFVFHELAELMIIGDHLAAIATYCSQVSTRDSPFRLGAEFPHKLRRSVSC